MRIKLHKNQRVFRKRRSGLRVFGSILVAAAVVVGSFFAAKYIAEHPVTPNDPQPSAQAQQETDATLIPDDHTPSDVPDTKPLPTNETIRGFYLPTTALQDTVKLNTVLNQAADAGFTHVVFDLKDSDGILYYQSETPRAIQANAFTEYPLSLEQTKVLFDTIRNAGLLPLPRLYAFMDRKAPYTLAGARIAHKDGNGSVWLDEALNKGGRAWLNPCKDEAQLYIIDLAKELRDLGAGGILLDGVQFPRQVSSADFGITNFNRSDVLTAFINKTRTMLGDSCPVILSCTANSTLGTDTVVYGDNPLTFTSDIVSPLLLTGSMPATITVGGESIQNTPDTLETTIKALVNQINVRIKVIDQNKPMLTPWLQANDYTPAQIKSAINGCIAGGTENYILYHPDGIYDFAALK